MTMCPAILKPFKEGNSEHSCLVVQVVHCPRVPGARGLRCAVGRGVSRKDRWFYL